MKSLSTLLIAGFFSFSVHANVVPLTINRHTGIANDSAKQSTLAPLLDGYYALKNALVSDDANMASAKADLFLKALNGVDMKSLSDKEHKTFMSLQDKLNMDARHISEMKNLPHQREHFASLSLNMYTLAKAAKLSSRPVYEEYCPMKKAYWLSSEAEIKNPYYGNEMLTCGQVKETL